VGYDHDELLLQEPWCEEEWVVAARLSPIVTRGKGRRGRRVVFEDADEDELLLKPRFNVWE
jgi:hypothetical protein